MPGALLGCRTLCFKPWAVPSRLSLDFQCHLGQVVHPHVQGRPCREPVCRPSQHRGSLSLSAAEGSNCRVAGASERGGCCCHRGMVGSGLAGSELGSFPRSRVTPGSKNTDDCSGDDEPAAEAGKAQALAAWLGGTEEQGGTGAASWKTSLTAGVCLAAAPGGRGAPGLAGRSQLQPPRLRFLQPCWCCSHDGSLDSGIWLVITRNVPAVKPYIWCRNPGGAFGCATPFRELSLSRPGPPLTAFKSLIDDLGLALSQVRTANAGQPMPLSLPLRQLLWAHADRYLPQPPETDSISLTRISSTLETSVAN
ncbi:uncharacterized protein LOC123644747 isoform X2 [Lemur catta]|uniref:uncharacterized protein LOC123644747 isoform X2 n=1 Tax=Lemur catta TaxID=9447 RepID=UPI001E266B97|nr:uncharacterized protein LOC123644747 isoform X2 [Lemur catta]